MALVGAYATSGVSSSQTTGATGRHSTVVALRVDGIISPASSDFIVRGLLRAAEDKAELVVIELDTPGGLDTSMRAIIRQILASPVPVATFVSPAGARAASAGTFILYASHIAAMTPASNVGAASPIMIGAPGGGGAAPEPPASPSGTDGAAPGQVSPLDKLIQPDRSVPESRGGDTMTRKVTNDAAAYIRSLAELRGRNGEFAEKAVRNAASMSAQEALRSDVIDLIATGLPDLLRQVNGREIKLEGGNTVVLATENASVERVVPDWRNQILGFLANPQVALILMMAGIFGLFYELTNPGMALPGVAGLICLLLALYAFQMLPVNWAGVALVAFGIVLMIAEVFLPSFGVIGTGGVVAFVLGGLFLMDTGVPGFDLSIPFLMGLAIVSAALLVAVGHLAMRAHKHRVVTGREEMVGLEGAVTTVGDKMTYAHVRGESWRVKSNSTLVPGDTVRVLGIDNLTLLVEPVGSAGSSSVNQTKSTGGRHVL